MSILTEADAHINGQRQQDYGPPQENLEKIARQWTLYLRQKYGNSANISSEDVCWMMMDLKKCRRMQSATRDSLIDAAGYIGLIEKLDGTPK